jgi:predicted RNase H-like nuclease (RuvC/YqgF family)
LRSACTVAGVARPVAEYIIGHDIDKLYYDKSPDVYPEHYRQEYAKVEPLINIFSSENRSLKKLSEKDHVIDALAKNGAELKEKVERIEGSKESLALLLQKVLELEKKLNEQKSA